MLNAAAIAHLLGVDSAPSTKPVTGLAFDTRRVEPGDVFFALPGEQTHGIEFADEAVERGAVLIVSDQPHQHGIVVPHPGEALLTLGRLARKRLAGPVIGITGSVGKTTTRVAIEAATNGRGTPGNYNTPYALAVTLFRAFVQQEQHGPAPLVLELGIDHVGEMATLLALTKPDHAVLTTIGPSHLTGLGTVQTVAREKVSLLAAAPGLRIAGLETAGWIPRELAEHITFVTVTEHPEPLERTPRSLVHGRLINDTVATLHTVTDLPHSGAGVAQAAVMGLVVANALQLDMRAAARRISEATWESGRLTQHEIGNLLVLDDTYNSNPLSVREALAALRNTPEPRHVVFGTMAELGEEEVPAHEHVAKMLQDAASVTLVGAVTKVMQPLLPNAVYYPDVTELISNHHWPTEGTLLVKGSRSIGLEHAVAHLLERL